MRRGFQPAKAGFVLVAAISIAGFYLIHDPKRVNVTEDNVRFYWVPVDAVAKTLTIVRILNRHRRFTSFNDPGLDTLKIVD
jgi:hypothetical protein